MCIPTAPPTPPAPPTISTSSFGNNSEDDATNLRDRPRRRVLVVGAGPSGLAAVKELLAVGDLEVVAVDGRSEIGGVFSPQSNVTFEDLYLTTSNMYMAFSDFPPTENYVKYWSKLEYYQYLVDYAHHFDLLPHIQLQTKVQQAQLNTQTKQWTVLLETWPSSRSGQKTLEKITENTPTTGKNNKNKSASSANNTISATNTSSMRTEIFDYLIVATGANNKPRIPPIFEGFTGQIMHSSQYHTAEQVRGKNVLIVGMGESSTDVAHSASKLAHSVTVWGRHYQDMAPRFLRDMVFDPDLDELKRLKQQDEDKLLPNAFLEMGTTARISRNLPLGVMSFCLHGLMYDISKKFGPQSAQQVIRDMDVSQWKEDVHSADTAETPTKSVIMAICAARGELDLAVAPKITCDKNKITFHELEYYGADFVKTDDGKNMMPKEIDVNVIVACTGYRMDMSWLDLQGFPPIKPNPRTWFKHCFPPSMGDHIAFLGLARPHSGGIPQCSEMLARYIAQIQMGNCALPTDYATRALQDGAGEEECFHNTAHNLLLVDYPAFMMSVARLIGCTPKMPWSPHQLVKFWTFPLWPCFFRTQGPGANPQACDAVLSKFGPYDSLAPMPLLAVQLIGSLSTPVFNLLSFGLNQVMDWGKTKSLPRAYKWRMSQMHFMYSEFRVLGWEDVKIALVGQWIATSCIVQHLVWSSLMEMLSPTSMAEKKACANT
ncbi:hypothetical protein ACA910_002527 [Epithemia clementina (nom. ined.)]